MKYYTELGTPCEFVLTIMLIIGIVIFQKLNNLKHKCFKIYPIP